MSWTECVDLVTGYLFDSFDRIYGKMPKLLEQYMSDILCTKNKKF